MKISILTLFPQMVEHYFAQSIMARAVQRGIVEYSVINFRDYALDRHKTADDAPYGGGAGMVLKCEPLARALDALNTENGRVVFPTPSGKLLTQERVRDLATSKELIFICGRYEGVDQRIIDEYVDDELSIGDYVISSGEVASLVIVDAVYRLLAGVISLESLIEESHEDGILEYPHYTRPQEFRRQEVPPILLSGDHERIRLWRRKEGLRKTLAMRPEILEQQNLTREDVSFLAEIMKESEYESG